MPDAQHVVSAHGVQVAGKTGHLEFTDQFRRFAAGFGAVAARPLPLRVAPAAAAARGGGDALGDPRATIQYALGQELCPDDELFKTALHMRAVAVEILSGIKKISNPYPNVDAVSGTLLNACGLTDSDYYTVLFGLARCSGIAAQIVDERVNARGGKGVPIYRPKYVAQDQDPRHVEG